MLLAIKKRYTLTIPKSLREQLHVQEGEYVDAEVKGDSFVLTPVKVIRKDQEYFWTKEWQEKEKEAYEDVQAGRLSRAYGENELVAFFKDLKKEAGKIAPKKN